MDSEAQGGSVGVAMVAAPKHLLITKDSSEISEDVVKVAALCASSPFEERVVLHAVGLGARFLSKDPYRSFCRLVQSGRSGLQWEVQEHDSWADFLTWLHGRGDAPPARVQQHAPPAVFGQLRGMELDLHRLAARTGGVAWKTPFPPEPFDQLRRWCRPTVVRSARRDEVVEAMRQLRGATPRPRPEVQVSAAAPPEEA